MQSLKQLFVLSSRCVLSELICLGPFALGDSDTYFDVVSMMSSEMGYIVNDVTVRTWRQKKTHRCRHGENGLFRWYIQLSHFCFSTVLVLVPTVSWGAEWAVLLCPRVSAPFSFLYLPCERELNGQCYSVLVFQHCSRSGTYRVTGSWMAELLCPPVSALFRSGTYHVMGSWMSGVTLSLCLSTILIPVPTVSWGAGMGGATLSFCLSTVLILVPTMSWGAEWAVLLCPSVFSTVLILVPTMAWGSWMGGATLSFCFSTVLILVPTMSWGCWMGGATLSLCFSIILIPYLPCHGELKWTLLLCPYVSASFSFSYLPWSWISWTDSATLSLRWGRLSWGTPDMRERRNAGGVHNQWSRTSVRCWFDGASGAFFAFFF